jgi:hypothetical protein
VGDGRPVHANVVVVAEVEEFLPCELGAIVSDDRVGYAEAVDNVGEKDTASSEQMLTIGRASIHLENLSTAMRR